MKHWTRWEKILVGLFLAWLAAGLVLLPLNLTPEQVQQWDFPFWLKEFVADCLEWGDFLLILFAAMNTYALTVRQWDRWTAAQWAVACLGIGAGIELLGVLTGFPFGPYEYGERLGPRLGEILPVAIPFAWWIVVTQFLFAIRISLPPLPLWGEAFAVATGATFFDALMEPFAVHVQGYWQWGKGGEILETIPLQNYIAWWITVAILVLLFVPRKPLRWAQEYRPLIILGGMALLFLIGQWWITLSQGVRA